MHIVHVIRYMHWFSHIAAWFALPLLAFSAWFGFHGAPIASTSTQPVACTMEAKECPDGSYVGRTGPDCAFAACPVSPATGTLPIVHSHPTPPPVTPTASLSIVSISPSSGAVGTTITLGGNGFTSDNIIHFGGGAIAHVAAAPAIFNCPMQAAGTTGGCGTYSQTLTFTVPQSVGPYCAAGMACPMYMQLITSGTYNVSVQNANGTSNAVSFIVTGANPFPTTQPLSVTGLDAPTTLALGQEGTWTVHVSVPDSTGQLHYSVTWGDEVNGAAQIMAPQPQQIQTSASFTHAYQRSGSYTATFTVTDDQGHSAQTSSTITVTPLY